MKPVDTVLIDADITAFSVCAAAEVETEWHDDIWTLHSDYGDVQRDFRDAIVAIQDMTAAKNVVLCFTGDTNFRKDIYAPYKSNRKNTRKPMHLKRVKAWASDVWEAHTWEGLEADDVLGILATNSPTSGVYSHDKDLLTVPAMLWNHDERFFYPQAEDIADYYWMTQTLTGDSTDGYPGCPGIGKKRAADMLGEPGAKPLAELWDQVVAIYEAKGLTAEDALVQAQLARILRNTDYSHEKGVTPWTPTK